MENAQYEEFEQRVLREARKQAEEMLREARESADAAVRNEDKGLEETVRAFEQESEKRAGQAVSRGRLENRRGLLEKRAALEKALFAEVEKRLEAFCESPAYLTFLCERLKKYPGMTAAGGKICLSHRDMALAEALQSAFPACEVCEDAEIVLGGFRLQAGAVMQNETFDAALRAEKEAFAAQSGLFF